MNIDEDSESDSSSCHSGKEESKPTVEGASVIELMDQKSIKSPLTLTPV